MLVEEEFSERDVLSAHSWHHCRIHHCIGRRIRPFSSRVHHWSKAQQRSAKFPSFFLISIIKETHKNDRLRSRGWCTTSTKEGVSKRLLCSVPDVSVPRSFTRHLAPASLEREVLDPQNTYKAIKVMALP